MNLNKSGKVDLADLAEVLSEAQNWAKINYFTFQRILEEEHLREKIRQDSLTKSIDVNSNPYCYIWMRSFPEAELAPARIRVLAVEVVSTGEKIGHSFFQFGNVIVDPTFGQFLDLDKAIDEHPESFVGRVLVDTSDNIEKKFGVRFELTNL